MTIVLSALSPPALCAENTGRERADATVVIAGDGLGVKQAAHGCCGSPPDAPSEGGRQEARGRRGGAQVDARRTATGFPVGLCDGARSDGNRVRARFQFLSSAVAPAPMVCTLDALIRTSG